MDIRLPDATRDQILGAPWWGWALSTWGLCLLLTIVVAIATPSNVWTVPRDAHDVGTLTSKVCGDPAKLKSLGMNLTLNRPDQCEAPRYESLIVEPENTWSNFAYLLAGLLILYRRPRPLGIAVGVNFCLMFLFSGLYHASLQNVPQSLDVSWIYALLLSLIAYSLETLRLRYARQPFPSASTILSIGIPVLIAVLVAVLKATGNLPSSKLTDSTNVTIALVCFLGIPVLIVLLDFWWLGWKYDSVKAYRNNLYGHDFIWREQWKFELWMFVPALVGLPGDGCGHSLCTPHSLFQAHAAWHILGKL
jgi:hypothetical protein